MMADPKSTTLPPALRGHVDHVKADEIDIPEERCGRRILDRRR